MARRILPGGSGANLDSVAEMLGEALCVVECVIASLDAREQSGPEATALQCALRCLNNAHALLVDMPP